MRHVMRTRRIAAGLMAMVAIAAAACSSGSSSTTTATTTPTNASGVGQPSPFLGANLTSVGCGSASLCVAVGTSFNPNPTSAIITAATDAGATWHPVRSAAPTSTMFTSVSCAAASCIAVGQASGAPWAIGATGGPHLTWVPTSPVPGSLGIDAVACSGTVWCMVIAGQAPPRPFATTDAGQSWQSLGSLPTTTTTISHVDCASRSRCVAVGVSSTGTAVIDRTTDGGGTWQSATLPTTTSSVVSAACSSTSRCMAAARSGSEATPSLLLSTDGGATFTLTALAATVVSPAAVSCHGATCVVVGASSTGSAAADRYTAAGHASPFTLTYLPTPLVSVSCATTTWCEAASASSLVSLAS